VEAVSAIESEEITTRGYFKEIAHLAMPVMFGIMMHNILHFADRYFIAKIGIQAAAATSMSGVLIWTIISFSSLVSGGTVALVSRKVGEKNLAEASCGAEQSLLLGLLLSIIISIISYLGIESVFRFYEAEAEVARLGILYFIFLIPGFPCMIIGSITAAIFQASGDTKTPVKVFMCMGLINLILDPILIFGLGPFPVLGVKGAAIATITAQFLALIVLIYKLQHFHRLPLLRFNRIRPNFNMITRILRIGVWTGLNSFSRPLSAIFVQKVLAFHGTAAVAGFSFGLQWVSILFIVLEGLRVAISTMVGQKLGAKNFAGVKLTIQAGLKFGFLAITGILFVGILLSRQLIEIFTDDPLVISLGSGYIVVTFIAMLLGIPMTVYTAAFNGSGDTRPPTVISFLANWLGKIGIAYIASYWLGFGPFCVWIAIAVSIVIEGIAMPLWFRRGKWQEKSV